jgi:hypothetical protein
MKEFRIFSKETWSKLSAISINPCFKVRPEAKGIYLERIGEDAAKKSFETVNINDIFAIEDPHFFAPTLLLDAKEALVKYIQTGLISFRDLLQSAERMAKPVLLRQNKAESPFSTANGVRLCIAGLGDVGTTLAIVLASMPSAVSGIGTIKIFDINPEKRQRWNYELSQINSPENNLPDIEVATRDNLEECDVFVFAMSKRVPAPGKEKGDVRLQQFRDNSGILMEYVTPLAARHFKGIVAILSDPVELLARYAITQTAGSLNPMQFVGLGLGVMHARAMSFNGWSDRLWIFGMHGHLTGIIDSIETYSESRSAALAKKVTTINLKMRQEGIKPYVAPAVSSGVYSLICMLNERPFWGSIWTGREVWGSKIRRMNGYWQWQSEAFSDRQIEKMMENRNAIDKLYQELS